MLEQRVELRLEFDLRLDALIATNLHRDEEA
jgi:hypothetical protein